MGTEWHRLSGLSWQKNIEGQIVITDNPVGCTSECPKWTIRSYGVHQTLTHWVHKGCKSSYLLDKTLLCFISDLMLGNLPKKKRQEFFHMDTLMGNNKGMCGGRCLLLGNRTKMQLQRPEWHHPGMGPSAQNLPWKQGRGRTRIQLLNAHTGGPLARTHDAPANCESACSWVLGMHAMS